MSTSGSTRFTSGPGYLSTRAVARQPRGFDFIGAIVTLMPSLGRLSCRIITYGPIGPYVIMANAHLRLHSRAADFLLACLQSVDTTFDALLHARAAARYGSDYRRVLRAKERADAKRDVARLRAQKYLTEKRVGDELHYALTAKGRIELCRLSVLESELFTDNRITMVVFDIPESEGNARRRMRRFLSSVGFAPLQKSVWISPFDAVKPLEDLFRMTKTWRWVRVFVATEMR